MAPRQQIDDHVVETDWQPAVIKPYKSLCQSFRDRMTLHLVTDEDSFEELYNTRMSGRKIRVRLSTGKQINERCNCKVLEVHEEDSINGGRYVPECSVYLD